MGFVVEENGLVRVDHNTRSYGVTTVSSNPTMAKTTCQQHPLRVFSIFRRHGYKGSGKGKGDNCPFIYAIKGKRGLYVNYSSIRDIVAPMNAILDKFNQEQQKNDISYDLIIPMPSSHNISLILAKRACCHLRGSNLNDGFFRKSTSIDIREQLNNSSIPHGAKVNISNALTKAENEQRPFSLSDVDTDYRQYILPLSLVGSLPNVNRILLVDDLFATGQTLTVAKDLIIAEIPDVTVEALCLFSPLDGRIRSKRRRER